MTQSWRPPGTLSPCGVRSVQLSLLFRYRILISFPKPSPEHFSEPVGQDIITNTSYLHCLWRICRSSQETNPSLKPNRISTMSHDRKPILIIGAGVVGLALAHGLKMVRALPQPTGCVPPEHAPHDIPSPSRISTKFADILQAWHTIPNLRA